MLKSAYKHHHKYKQENRKAQLVEDDALHAKPPRRRQSRFGGSAGCLEEDPLSATEVGGTTPSFSDAEEEPFPLVLARRTPHRRTPKALALSQIGY